MTEAEKWLSRRGSRRRGAAFFVTPTVAEEAFLEEDQDFMNEVFFDEGTRDADMEPRRQMRTISTTIPIPKTTTRRSRVLTSAAKGCQI